MKLKILRNTFLLLMTTFLFNAQVAGAEVKVPDFSFMGKEIAHFKTKPAFTVINLNFSKAKSFNTYMDNLKMEAANIDKDEYSSSDPGDMYSGSFGTGLSAVFVGNKAYRNYLVKQYINNNYLNVINGYIEYKDKFTGGVFQTEVKYLYASSLMKLGSTNKASKALEEIALGKSKKFSHYAQDLLFDYYKKVGLKQKILDLSGKIKNFSPFGLYVYIDTLYNSDKYQQILSAFSDYPDYINNYQIFNNYVIAAEYFLGRLEKIAKEEPFSEVSRYFITDALIKTGSKMKASKIISTLDNNNKFKPYFQFKIHILNKSFRDAAESLNRIVDPNDKLSLFFFYLSENFPAIRPEIMDMFSFENPVNRDYLNYYKGLYFLREQEYDKSAAHFENVIFKENLVTNSYFYKGICYSFSNRSRSQNFFIRYLNNGNTPEKINIARFMLAQFYFFDQDYQKVLMLMNSCKADFCEELKAQVAMEKSEFRKVLDILGDIKSKKAFYLRAAAQYNLKNYQQGLNNLQKIEEDYPGKDLLKMMTHYKLRQFDEGIAIFKKNKNNREFIQRTVRQLFLINQYMLVVNIVNELDNVTPQQKLIKAKALYSLEEYDKAEAIYSDFLERKMFLNDTISGLISIKSIKGVDREFVENGFKWIDGNDFKDENVIALEFARLAFSNNYTDLGIKYLNYFFNNYPSAENMKNAYIIRSDFFYNKEKYKECVMDINSAINRFGESGELLLQKAKCLREKSPETALSIYRNLSDSEQFSTVAKRNILKISDNASEVLTTATHFADTENITYLQGIERYLNLLDISELPENENYIYKLVDSGIKRFTPAAKYFLASLNFANGKKEDAASSLMKIYYLHTDTEYATKSLKLAKKAFEDIGDKKNAQKVSKILENKEE